MCARVRTCMPSLANRGLLCCALDANTHPKKKFTFKIASSLALSVSVTRSVTPLKWILRGLSNASCTTCVIGRIFKRRDRNKPRVRPMPACNEPPHQSLQLVVLIAAGKQDLRWEALWTSPPLQVAVLNAKSFAQAAHVAASAAPSSTSHKQRDAAVGETCRAVDAYS